jgi:biopolymer transport protein ExbD
MMAFSGFSRPQAFFARRPKLEPEINLIALIDLLLVVMIFVLVSSTLSTWSQLGLNLASSRAGTDLRSGGLRVAVLRDGSIRIGDAQVLNGLDAAALVKALTDAQTRPAAPRGSETQPGQTSSVGQSPQVTTHGTLPASLLIFADRLAPHGAVVRVMDAARQAGIERVGLVTQKD